MWLPIDSHNTVYCVIEHYVCRRDDASRARCSPLLPCTAPPAAPPPPAAANRWRLATACVAFRLFLRFQSADQSALQTLASCKLKPRSVPGRCQASARFLHSFPVTPVATGQPDPATCGLHSRRALRRAPASTGSCSALPCRVADVLVSCFQPDSCCCGAPPTCLPRRCCSGVSLIHTSLRPTTLRRALPPLTHADAGALNWSLS